MFSSDGILGSRVFSLLPFLLPKRFSSKVGTMSAPKDYLCCVFFLGLSSFGCDRLCSPV